MSHKVFISHASSDKGIADKVCRKLENQRIPCWIAPRDIRPGTEYAAAIIEAIDTCSVFVLIFSKHADNSNQVKREVNQCVDKEKILLTFRVEDFEMSDTMQYYLKNTHWRDGFEQPLDQQLGRLVDDVQHFIKKGSDVIDNGIPKLPPKPKLRKYLFILIICTCTVTLILLCLHFCWRRPAEKCDAFIGAAYWLNFIVYDPVNYDPYMNIMPSESSIRKDINILRTYDFDGLITMNCKGTLKHIARIAKEEGFNQVIVGIYDLRDEEELENAISVSNWADAYCVGSRGLNRFYSKSELKDAVKLLRRKTTCCISTTESIVDYLKNPDIISMIDFLFPDVSITDSCLTPEYVYDSTIKTAKYAAEKFQSFNKPIFLKMISFPSGGSGCFSDQKQKNFYYLMLEKAIERKDIPNYIIFTFMSAFDPVWKTDENFWPVYEKYTGLFTSDRQPKPAILEVQWRKKHH